VKLLIARRLLRDTNAERQRMTLTHLISEGFKGRHGVKLNQPDWSDRSHRIAFSAELAKEDILMFAIFSAYWEPLDSSFHGAPCEGHAVAALDWHLP
jgi:isoamylase